MGIESNDNRNTILDEIQKLYSSGSTSKSHPIGNNAPPLNKGPPVRLEGFVRVNKGPPRFLEMLAREARQKKNRVFERFTRRNRVI